MYAAYTAIVIYTPFIVLQNVFSYAILLSSALWFVRVDARPNGAPIEACAAIEPQHASNSRQSGPPRYSPRTSNFPNATYIPGQTYIGKCI